MTRLMASAVYAIPQRRVHDHASVVTNTTPIVAYRGAGRPEATAAIERAMDLFAAEIGMDPVEVRRRNLIPKFAEPHTTVDRRDLRRRRLRGARSTRRSTPPATTSCGPSRRGAGASRRRRAARHRRQRATSRSPAACRRPSEDARIEVHADGAATVLHRHVAARPGPRHGVVDDRLRRAPASRWTASTSCDGDTDLVPVGGGTMGSRSLQQGGAAVHQAAIELVDRRPGRSPPTLLEADAADVVLDTDDRRASTSPARRRWRRRWAELAGARRPATTAAERRRRSSPAAARRSRSAPTSRWSRSTPRPARSSCSATSPATTPARILNPLLARGPDPRRHRPGRGPGAARGGALRRRRQPAHRRTSPTTRFISAAELPSFEVVAHGDADAASTRSAPRASASRARSARRRRCRPPWSTPLSHLGVRHIDMPCTRAGVAGDHGRLRGRTSNMRHDFSGKVAVVTGAGSGIGRVNGRCVRRGRCERRGRGS